MEDKETILSVYKRKGVLHYAVLPIHLLQLSGEEYNNLRQKVIHMIGVMEDVWRLEQIRKQEITPKYLCKSYFEDGHIIDCTCGKCY